MKNNEETDFTKATSRMRIIQEHTYDDFNNGHKVKKYLEANGGGKHIEEKIDEIIDQCVLCPAEYLDEEQNILFQGVRICTRELVDLYDELTIQKKDKDIMMELYSKAQTARWKTTEKLFKEYQGIAKTHNSIKGKDDIE